MIEITEILGTDSLSSSRITINENFQIVTEEINSITEYLSTESGELTNITLIQSSQIEILQNNSVLFSAGPSGIVLNNGQNGTTTISGGSIILNDSKILNQSINLDINNDINQSPVAIGGENVPPFSIERVGNSDTTPLILDLAEGLDGQEITFVYTTATTGEVQIISTDESLIVPDSSTGSPSPSGSNIVLDGQGQTVKLLSINGIWYIIGGVGYTI